MYSYFTIISLLQVIVTVRSNPFHKYPFVFLLDVGNEEIENINTEQIRISSPGGSIAFRYPAFGDPNTITHVRVSGIDFGTDLRADIIDGGPGYNYVIIAFVGNPGVEYDAVVTIKSEVQDLNDGTINGLIKHSPGDILSRDDGGQGLHQNTLQVETNSIDDDNDIKVVKNLDSNIEMIQSSSSHNYEVNEEFDEEDPPEIVSGYSTNLNSKQENLNSADADLKNYAEVIQDTRRDDNLVNDSENNKYSLEDDTLASGGKLGYHGKLFSANAISMKDAVDYIEETNAVYEDNPKSDSEDSKPIADAYNYNKNYLSDDTVDEYKPINVVDNFNLYKKYQALKPNFGFKVYPQATIDGARNRFENEEPLEQEQEQVDKMYDDEANDDSSKAKDLNNNEYDNYDEGAVDY